DRWARAVDDKAVRPAVRPDSDRAHQKLPLVSQRGELFSQPGLFSLSTRKFLAPVQRAVLDSACFSSQWFPRTILVSLPSERRLPQALNPRASWLPSLTGFSPRRSRCLSMSLQRHLPRVSNSSGETGSVNRPTPSEWLLRTILRTHATCPTMGSSWL